MTIVATILEKRIRAVMEADDMQCGFMPERGTIDDLFIVRRMQEEHREKNKKFHICFMDLEKAFDRVPRRVMQWAPRKKGLTEILAKPVISLYESSKMKVKVGSEFSKEFFVAVGVHQGSVLLPLLFAIVMDVVTENAIEGLMKKVLYADDVVLMIEMMKDLKERFLKWRSALDSKD